MLSKADHRLRFTMGLSNLSKALLEAGRIAQHCAAIFLQTSTDKMCLLGVGERGNTRTG